MPWKIAFSDRRGPNVLERASLALDIGSRDDRPPLFQLGFLKCGERLRRLLLGRIDFLAKTRQSLAHRWISHRTDDGFVELRHDAAWRALRGPDGIPLQKMKTGRAGLIHGRH